MTNFERWRLYTDDLPSPDSYINWSYRFMIASALQRRVWCPPAHDRLYPNMYPILVGEPGIGKGGPIRRVNDILTQFKLGDDKVEEGSKLSVDEQAAAIAIQNADLKLAVASEVSGHSREIQVDKPLLIPTGADSTSYEQLMRRMSESYRRINYPEWHEPAQKEIMKIYGHCSMYFCLEELKSLLKKNTESLLRFLIQAFDCGEEYVYETKHQGKDRIRRLCLNFMAGVTPDDMQELFTEGIFGSGFSARVLFIYAAKNRKPVFFRPELTTEQLAAKDEISKHVKKLTKLYGQIKLDSHTPEFLLAWLMRDQENPQKRASSSSKLKAYYARKNIHIMKVAMALHFGESTDMYIPHERFEEAIKLLDIEERTMHLALTMGGDNPMSKVAPQIKNYLEKTGKHTFNEIWAEHFEKLPRKGDIEEVLTYLMETGQVRLVTVENELTKEKSHMYEA